MPKPITRKRMEEIAAEEGLDAEETRIAIDGILKLVAGKEKNGGK